MAKFCPYCKCLMLSDGHCRNRKCLLGKKSSVTDAQAELILKLCEEIGIDTTNRDPYKLSFTKAQEVIDKLLKRKQNKEMYGSEVDDDC